MTNGEGEGSSPTVEKFDESVESNADELTVKEDPTVDGTAESQQRSSKEETDDTTGLHSIAPFWDNDIDTAALEKATDKAQTQRRGESPKSGDPLDRKIDSWKEQLLDLTRGSNLVNFTVTKTKSLPFHRADPLTIAEQLFEQQPLYVHRSESEEESGSLPDVEPLADNEVASIRLLEDTQNSLSNLQLKQKQLRRERGVDSLFIAIGTLRWYDVDHSDSELRTPLFLVQATLSEEPNRDSNRHNYEISSEDSDLQINPALRKLLLSERGITLPPDEAFHLNDLETAFAFVSEIISGFDRWRIVPEVILGIFDFSKFSLYTDLEENRQAIKDNAFVQAINGDPSALRTPPEAPSAEQLDETVSPADTYQVLDADSSQQEAIEAAKRGVSFVLQGPPGTGKSQTIANILAEKMATGETVLFVSEKQAALQVVKDRLNDVGLGRFCLEAHGEKASKKEVLEDLGRELQSEPLAHPTDRNRIVSELQEVRSTLNQYKERLFYTPAGQDITPYQAFGIVANQDTHSRLSASFEDPTEYSQSQLDTIRSNLKALTAYEDQLSRDGSHPWQHTTLDGWQIDTHDQVQTILQDVQSAVRSLQEQTNALETYFETDFTASAAIREAVDSLSHLRNQPETQLTAAHLEEEFYQQSTQLTELKELTTDLEEKRSQLLTQYDRTIFEERGVDLHGKLNTYGILRYVSPSYFRFKSRILAHATDEYAPGLNGLKEDAQQLLQIQAIENNLDDYQQLREQMGPLYTETDTDWEAVFRQKEWIETALESEYIDKTLLLRDTNPASPEETYKEVTRAFETWQSACDELSEIIDLKSVTIDGTPFREAPLAAVEKWISTRLDTLDQLQEWVQYKQQRATVLSGPAGEFLMEFVDQNGQPEHLMPTFKRNFYEQWLKAVYSDTNLDQFSATEFNTLLSEFRRLDQQQREYAKGEIQHRVTSRRPKTELQHASSAGQSKLRREIQKSRRQIPLRELFDETASLITDLKPVFMMSPVSVAQYLRHDSIEFDTVVFDEASQIMPQDAISSIIRGSQVIIAGDSKQLPPTTFFQSDTEAADDVREDLESILDEMSTVLSEKRLLWHYRSRTNELIEFSNVKYYNGTLRTFPDNNPEEEMGVQFEYVENGLYDRGGSSINEPEAQRVLELIQEHIENRPDKSLGVVAFSSAQAQAIRDTIEHACDDDPTLDAFVAEDDALEGFFVKSLENVQGDERDALIFSVGYGPDSAGKMSMNFGPLNKTGGERRLNVAVTRAKELIQIVSSIQPGEIDLGRTGARGVEDFKHYLEYAKHGDRILDREDSEPQFLHFDSEFEESVYTALEKEGLDVATQVSSSGYSIDLAIKHPEQPGKYVLGVECDGAAYHSSQTARDRDRTRQSVLEGLGWTIHRIWSPDWATNKQREVDEIVSRVNKLTDENISTDGGTTEISIEPVTVDPIPKGQRGGIDEYVSTWQEPKVRRLGDRSFDDIDNGRLAGQLKTLIENYGPIERDIAFKLTISVWKITRLGKNIRSTMGDIAVWLHNRDHLVQSDGFFWPGERPDSIPVRVNDGDASRTVDEIPLEELARSAEVLLEAGNEMEREDLVLETARLFEYQRIGSRIHDRIDNAIDILVRVGCANELNENDMQVISHVDTNVDDRLLDRLY